MLVLTPNDMELSKGETAPIFYFASIFYGLYPNYSIPSKGLAFLF